jgi:hypothetical protein
MSSEATPAGVVVGIFASPAAADSAVESLDAAGFGSEEIALVSPEQVDTHALALLTNVPAEEWQEEIADLGGAVILVQSADRPREVAQLLREAGAQQVIESSTEADGAPRPAHEQRPAAAAGIQPGMTVMSAERIEIGRVKRLEGLAMLVDRPLQRDVWVPFTWVDRVIEHWVVLKLPQAEVDLPFSFLRKR